MRKTPREVYRKKKKLFVLTQVQKDVLLGTILGDAGIRYRGNECRMHIKHSLNQISLTNYLRKIFDPITSMPVRVFDQQVRGKNYSFSEFVTLTHPVFTKYHQLFYSGKTKSIPGNIGELLLNPLSLAVWIMDDGSAEYAGLSIQTHSFSLGEVMLLAKVIKQNFELNTLIHSNKGKYILYFPKSSMSKLISITGNYILPEFKYKFVPYSIR